MKNIQVIDAAENCTYSLFTASDGDFTRLFPDDQDIAFMDEVEARLPPAELEAIFRRLWERPLLKPEARGIHGTLFYGMAFKKKYFPTRKESEIDPLSINDAQRRLYARTAPRSTVTQRSRVTSMRMERRGRFVVARPATVLAPLTSDTVEQVRDQLAAERDTAGGRKKERPGIAPVRPRR